MVGGVENHLRRSVILFQLDDLGIRVVLLEGQDVAHVGAAEPVDRLIVIADDGQVAMRACQMANHQVLRPVGVLVLVDHDVLEALLIFLENLGMPVEEPDRAHQQIVEVERVVLLQERVVAKPDSRRQLLGMRAGRLQLVFSTDDLVLGA